MPQRQSLSLLDLYCTLFSSYDVMCSCWKTDPIERPSFQDLLSHLETLKQVSNLVNTRFVPLPLRFKKYINGP